jgi:hypothetical protein
VVVAALLSLSFCRGRKGQVIPARVAEQRDIEQLSPQQTIILDKTSKRRLVRGQAFSCSHADGSRGPR